MHHPITLRTLALLTALTSPLLAADPGLAPKPEDSIQTVLKRQVGNKVELRLESGSSVAGKVESVGDTTVFLSNLTGAEFYEAVVILDDITAIVARSAAK